MNDAERIQIESHLKALSICYYVWGGLIGLTGLLGFLYVVGGIFLIAIPEEAFAAEMANNPNLSPQDAASAAAGTRGLGALFAAVGCVVVLFGAAFGALAVMSGRAIAARRRRTFSLVIAGISCASVPLGTVLGVFTFVLLGKPAAKELYAEAEAAESYPGLETAGD